MNIKFTNIGTGFEKFEIFLDVSDYVKLFKEEIGFGKLLSIYEELGKIISEDPERLREWVLSGIIERYNGVIDVSNNICSILGEKISIEVKQ